MHLDWGRGLKIPASVCNLKSIIQNYYTLIGKEIREDCT
jgi:hypothetical protein